MQSDNVFITFYPTVIRSTSLNPLAIPLAILPSNSGPIKLQHNVKDKIYALCWNAYVLAIVSVTNNHYVFRNRICYRSKV